VTQPDHQVSPAVPLAAALVSGALVAVQQRINGDLGQQLQAPLLAAVVSFGSGLLVVSAVLLARRGSRALLPRLREVPWWTRLGGLGGASLVAVGATAAPEIGVALLTVGLVGGSTVAALLVDTIGLGPGGVRAITPARAAGAGLCLLAIALSAADGIHAASPLLLVLVVLAGGLISFQQAVNGRVRHATDATVATFVNFVVGTTGLALGLLVHNLFVGQHLGHWPGLSEAYLYLGGTIGAAFVATAALVVRSLGVLRLGLAVTAGQILGALLLDADRGIPAATGVAAGLTLVAVGVSGRGQA
jgi:transporter family-2 protein